jgi:hypothetical protein
MWGESYLSIHRGVDHQQRLSRVIGRGGGGVDEQYTLERDVYEEGKVLNQKEMVVSGK